MSAETKRGRGRPAYVPDQPTRAKVTLWIAGGINAPEIAHLLGVSLPTVHKVFAEELATRGAEVKAKVLEATLELALKGNASAQGKLLTRFDNVEAAAANGGKKPDKLGKKEQRQVQAEQRASTGRFAVPQPPKLVVANG